MIKEIQHIKIFWGAGKAVLRGKSTVLMLILEKKKDLKSVITDFPFRSWINKNWVDQSKQDKGNNKSGNIGNKKQEKSRWDEAQIFLKAK